MLTHARMYADGGARGNPGPAGGAAVLFALAEDGNVGERIADASVFLGHATNNQAEYAGLIVGLKKAHELGVHFLDVCLDSELLVKQLNREYRVKNPDLAKRFLEVQTLLAHFRRVTFRHVRRAFNKDADNLVNRTIDAALGL